jgi:hypothetical protein
LGVKLRGAVEVRTMEIGLPPGQRRSWFAVVLSWALVALAAASGHVVMVETLRDFWELSDARYQLLTFPHGAVEWLWLRHGGQPEWSDLVRFAAGWLNLVLYTALYTGLFALVLRVAWPCRFRELTRRDPSESPPREE